MAPKYFSIIILTGVLIFWASCDAAAAQADPTSDHAARHHDAAISVVELSRDNINRIHSTEPIKKINAPSSLALEVEYQGNDAFIKLGKNAKPGVIYIITQSGEVFSLEIVPQKGVKARVINLESKNRRVRENQVRFAKLDPESAAVDLIRSAFADTIPDSFNVTENSEEVNTIRSLRIISRRKVTMDGVPLELKEYLVSIAPLAGFSEIGVEESTFLLPRLTRQPTAIALGRDLATFMDGKAVLKKGQYLRLFIVEHLNPKSIP
ncbi:MAG: type-F conjugative transfer system secretin TraK [Desulfobacterales bacterium]